MLLFVCLGVFSCLVPFVLGLFFLLLFVFWGVVFCLFVLLLIFFLSDVLGTRVP